MVVFEGNLEDLEQWFSSNDNDGHFFKYLWMGIFLPNSNSSTLTKKIISEFELIDRLTGKILAFITFLNTSNSDVDIKPIQIGEGVMVFKDCIANNLIDLYFGYDIRRNEVTRLIDNHRYFELEYKTIPFRSLVEHLQQNEIDHIINLLSRISNNVGDEYRIKFNLKKDINYFILYNKFDKMNPLVITLQDNFVFESILEVLKPFWLKHKELLILYGKYRTSLNKFNSFSMYHDYPDYDKNDQIKVKKQIANVEKEFSRKVNELISSGKRSIRFLSNQINFDNVDFKGKSISNKETRIFFYKDERKYLAGIYIKYKYEFNQLTKKLNHINYVLEYKNEKRNFENEIIIVKSEIKKIIQNSKLKKISNSIYSWFESIAVKIISEKIF